jgi:hypothetical protein
MLSLQVISNLRNYLYARSLPDLLDELTVSVLRGETDRADYIRKYIREVWDECEGCTGHENCSRCPGRDASIYCVNCGENLNTPHIAGCFGGAGLVELDDCIGWED